MFSRRSTMGIFGYVVSAQFGDQGVESRADIRRIFIPDSVQAVVASGFELPGDKGAGALYIRGTADGLMSLKDARGNWWNLCAGSEVWAGWFGVLGKGDDTVAMQRAIDHIAAQPQGGTVRISAGTYKIRQQRGLVELANRQPENEIEHSDRVDRQAYCLHLPNNVALIGEFGVVFKGAYVFGDAGLKQLVCITFHQSPLVENIRIDNITFSDYFVAVGIFVPYTTVLCCFERLTFLNCAIGLYSRGLERCCFERTIGQGTGALVVVGGHWSRGAGDYNEGGGFSDKTDFGTIHNIYQRPFGEAEREIDEYFDTYFFKSKTPKLGKNDTGSDISNNPRFPYRGICGRAVYLMARYGRPNNANRFGLVSHSYAPRAAVWIDVAVACVGQLVYLEGCGYRDNVKRLDPIGVTGIDPYLGAGVRVPAFVRGIACTIDAQFVFAHALNPGNTNFEATFWCDLEVKD